MSGVEQAVSFQCQGDRLVGILHPTQAPARRAARAAKFSLCQEAGVRLVSMTGS